MENKNYNKSDKSHKPHKPHIGGLIQLVPNSATDIYFHGNPQTDWYP